MYAEKAIVDREKKRVRGLSYEILCSHRESAKCDELIESLAEGLFVRFFFFFLIILHTPYVSPLYLCLYIIYDNKNRTAKFGNRTKELIGGNSEERRNFTGVPVRT